MPEDFLCVNVLLRFDCYSFCRRKLVKITVQLYAEIVKSSKENFIFWFVNQIIVQLYTIKTIFVQ